jgi:GxxExxY protein
MEQIKNFANEVFSKLGPGYSERVYHNAMEVMLREHNIPYETERIVPIEFHGHTIGNIRADLIVANSIIVELKAVKNIQPQMEIQTRNYLQLLGLPHGMVVNFPQVNTEYVEISVVAKDI